MVIDAGLEKPIRCGTYEFHGEKDDKRLQVRIAKVRLAKVMKLKGYALDSLDWDALDVAAADRELRRIGGDVPAGGDGNTRIYGGLTEEEFDIVLEPKDSWETFESLDDKMRLERQQQLIRYGC